MASTNEATVTRGDWKKKESFGSAFLQILVVAAVLSVGVFFVFKSSNKKKEVNEILKNAKELATKGNPQNLAQSLAEVEKALAIDEGSADALGLAAGLTTEQWLTQHLPDAETKARDYIQRAVKADSNSSERYAAEALVLLNEGKIQEADKFVDDLRKKGANSPRLWHVLGLTQWAAGNLQVARQALTTAVEREWREPRYAVSLGEFLMAESNWAKASEVLSKAAAANPEHLQLRLMAAWINVIREERVKEASETLQSVLSQEAALSPSLKAWALATGAEVAIYATEFAKAVEAATAAETADARSYWAKVAKARALAMKKDVTGAVEAFKSATAVKKTYPFAYLEGAKWLQLAGNHPAAMGLLTEYESVFKDVKIAIADGTTAAFIDRDDRYWITRGDVLKEAKKFEDALAAYEKGIAAANTNVQKAHLAKGSLFLLQKEYDKAEETLIAIAPESGLGILPEAYFTLGDVMFAKKNWEVGCQNFAFGMTRLRAQQASYDKLNTILTDVQKKLLAANQGNIAKAWMTEGKKLIQ